MAYKSIRPLRAYSYCSNTGARGRSMESLMRLTDKIRHEPAPTPSMSAKDAYDLARAHLERGAQEDYLVWTMIAEFLDAVEKQALRPLN